MNKNLSLVLLVCIGIGIGVGISELGKHFHTQDFIPNQYDPTAQQDSIQDSAQPELAQDSQVQNLKEQLAQSPQEHSQEDSQIVDVPTPTTQANTPEEHTIDSTPNIAIAQDIFSQERQIPQFQEYATSIYQGQFVHADESCVNCEGGPQEALKRGIIDFGGKYAIYTLKPNYGEIIIGVVNVENGEVLEFPTIYKEVAPPFDVHILAKPDSELIWLKGVDSKNPDVYKIEAYVLKNGNFTKVQGFEIRFAIPESLDSHIIPTQPDQDLTF